MKIQYFCNPFLKHVWLFRHKIKGHQAFNLFQLLFTCRASQVVPPSKQGHVSPKAYHTGLHYTYPSMDRDSSNSVYLQGSPSSNQVTHNLFLPILPYPLHQPLLVVEVGISVIEHMEICSGTDLEPEVQMLIGPYCQQIFDIHEKIQKHIGIHITRYISNLHNLSQQIQQPGRVNWSHEHFPMKRL